MGLDGFEEDFVESVKGGNPLVEITFGMVPAGECGEMACKVGKRTCSEQVDFLLDVTGL